MKKKIVAVIISLAIFMISCETARVKVDWSTDTESGCVTVDPNNVSIQVDY